MQDQNRKIFRTILGGGIIMLLLMIPEISFAKFITRNNPENLYSTLVTLVIATAIVYVIFSVIKIAKYQKFVNEYKQNQKKEASKKLTSEFKQVLLNYSEPISKELFECQAKVDDDGKIICKIQLDYEVKLESYEKFLKFFHFTQD